MTTSLGGVCVYTHTQTSVILNVRIDWVLMNRYNFSEHNRFLVTLSNIEFNRFEKNILTIVLKNGCGLSKQKHIHKRLFNLPVKTDNACTMWLQLV